MSQDARAAANGDPALSFDDMMTAQVKQTFAPKFDAIAYSHRRECAAAIAAKRMRECVAAMRKRT